MGSVPISGEYPSASGRTPSGRSGHRGRLDSRVVTPGMAVAVRGGVIAEPAADRKLAKPAIGRPWRRWLSGGLVAIAVLAGVGYVLRGWLSADRSVDRSRV